MTQSKTPDESILAGYKGSEEMDAAVYFTPYVPQPLAMSPWDAFLHEAHARHSVYPSTLKRPQDLIMETIGQMQERWPGPYTVEEIYDTKTMKFVYTMVFDSVEDKALFVLKHS